MGNHLETKTNLQTLGKPPGDQDRLTDPGKQPGDLDQLTDPGKRPGDQHGPTWTNMESRRVHNKVVGKEISGSILYTN